MDPDVDKEVLDRTEEEVLEGKASGPFTRSEVDARLGSLWTPAGG